MIQHGSVMRPTMFLASMDVKTAFDEARPRHVAQIMEESQYPWGDNYSFPTRDGRDRDRDRPCLAETRCSFPLRCLRSGSVPRDVFLLGAKNVLGFFRRENGINFVKLFLTFWKVKSAMVGFNDRRPKNSSTNSSKKQQ